MNKIVKCGILTLASMALAACTQQAPVSPPQQGNYQAREGGQNPGHRHHRLPDLFRIPMALNCYDLSNSGQHDVWDWQEFLICNRFLTSMPTPNELFGPTTESATTMFQQMAQVHTPNAGKVDRLTYNAALVYTVNHCPLTNTTPGATGCP